MATFTATARIQVTLEIEAGSHWGPDCTVEQVRDQAGREAVNRLTRELKSADIAATVIGSPAVVVVMCGETQAMRSR